jgi:hypothetical protein
VPGFSTGRTPGAGYAPMRATRCSSRYSLEGRRRKRGLAGGSHMAAPVEDPELADARALAPTDPCGSARETGAPAETAPAS